MLELILLKVRVLIADNPSFASLSDEYLMVFVEQGYSDALGYCNVKELPESAVGTIALMVVEMLPKNTGSGGVIQSMTEGSHSVTFRAEESTDAVLLRYQKALNRYKAVRCR